MALGRSSALNSCSIESMMFFQPSLRMLPCRWARSKTVLAAVCALPLLPNTVGRFSTDCMGQRTHQHSVKRHSCTVTEFKYSYSYNVALCFLELWSKLYLFAVLFIHLCLLLQYMKLYPVHYTKLCYTMVSVGFSKINSYSTTVSSPRQSGFRE